MSDYIQTQEELKEYMMSLLKGKEIAIKFFEILKNSKIFDLTFFEVENVLKNDNDVEDFISIEDDLKSRVAYYKDHPISKSGKEIILAIQTMMYPFLNDILEMTNDYALFSELFYNNFMLKAPVLFTTLNDKIASITDPNVFNIKAAIMNHMMNEFLLNVKEQFDLYVKLYIDSEEDEVFYMDTPLYVYLTASSDKFEQLWEKYRNVLPHRYYNMENISNEFHGKELLLATIISDRKDMEDNTIQLIIQHLDGKDVNYYDTYTYNELHTAIVFNKYKDLTQGIIPQ